MTRPSPSRRRGEADARNEPDPDAFPTQQLAIIAICRFSEPIAFNSILAYTYVMVKDLHDGDDTNASFYAGLLVSAYAVAEALTAMGWGTISDRYGRKPVVLIGLGGVALSCLIFGLAERYWVALLARFIGGALNGNVAVMQTMVAEMVKKPEHEPRAYAVQPFVWSLGSILGSAMGGYLAQPAKFYPSIFPEDGLFGRYPYLLPNLVAVAIISSAIIQGMIFLKETNPYVTEREQAVDDNGSADIDETTPLRRPLHRDVIATRTASPSRKRAILDDIRELRKTGSFVEEGLPTSTEQGFDLRRQSFGTMHSIKLPQEPEPQPDHSSRATFNFTVLMVSGSLVLAAYHQMAFFSVLPIYILDEPVTPPGNLDLIGGIGYTLHDVGTYMAVNGVIAMLIQAVIFPLFVERVGVWKSFVTTITLYPITYMVLPFLSMLPESLISPGIYAILLLQNLFGIIAVPCGLILLKNAVPSSAVLGKVNGFAMSACCAARTVSPPLVGIIYSAGGSAAAWFSCAGVALAGSIQLYWVPREPVDRLKVENAFKATDRDETNGVHASESAIEDD